MTEPIPRDVLRKIRKLAQLAIDLPQTRWGEAITRLTSLKSLCREPDVANRFVTYLASRTLERVERGEGRTRERPPEQDGPHSRMMRETLHEIEKWLQSPGEEGRQRLSRLRHRMEAEQNEYKWIKANSVRIIRDADLLLFEYAAHCLLGQPEEAGDWAYQTARQYAERYQSQYANGLTPSSAPLVQDIAAFWAVFYNLDLSALASPVDRKTRPKHSASGADPEKPATRTGTRQKKREPTFTDRQGQFLAFIHFYHKLHRRGPAELDMVKFFRVTPPSVHGMIVKLEELGLVTREPGVPRSVRVAIPAEDLPALEDTKGPPW